MESHIAMEEHFERTEDKFFWKAKPNITMNNTNKVRGWINAFCKKKDFITEGTYGKVSYCELRKCERLCIVKTLKRLTSFESEMAEIDILRIGIECEYFPDLFYAGFNIKDEYIIIMECVSGGTLRHHRKENSDISFEAIKVIAYQIANGVQFLHDRGYTHGDIKDDNIALTADGNVKLLDFGNSRKISTPQVLPLQCIYCAAPEIIEQTVASFPSDWWSYGVLLTELIQKKLPFKYGTKQITREKILNGEPDLSGITDNVAKDLIQKLLQKDPNERLTFVLLHDFLQVANPFPLFVPEPKKEEKKEADAGGDCKNGAILKAEVLRQNVETVERILLLGYIVGPTARTVKRFKND